MKVPGRRKRHRLEEVVAKLRWADEAPEAQADRERHEWNRAPRR